MHDIAHHAYTSISRNLEQNTRSAWHGDGGIRFRATVAHSVVAQTFGGASANNAAEDIDLSKSHALLIQHFGYREAGRCDDAAMSQVVMVAAPSILIGGKKPELILGGTGEIEQVVEIGLIILLRVGVAAHAGERPGSWHDQEVRAAQSQFACGFGELLVIADKQ